MSVLRGLAISLCLASIVSGFSIRSSGFDQRKVELSASKSKDEMSRLNFLQAVVCSTALLVPQKGNALASYSSNARNMERLAAGDSSGGGVFDNDPPTKAGRRRRAMTGCKIPSAREEAANLLKQSSLEEKDCNVRVMDESPDFMLQAMKNLECPSCPYGVNPKPQ